MIRVSLLPLTRPLIILLGLLPLLHGLELTVAASQLIRQFSSEQMTCFMESIAPSAVGLRPIFTLLHSLRGYFDFGHYWDRPPIDDYLEGALELAKNLGDFSVLESLLPMSALQSTERGRQWLIARSKEYSVVAIAVKDWKPALWEPASLTPLLDTILAAPASQLIDDSFCWHIDDITPFLVNSHWILVDVECLKVLQYRNVPTSSIIELLLEISSATGRASTLESPSLTLLAKIRLAGYHRSHHGRHPNWPIIKAVRHNKTKLDEALLVYAEGNPRCTDKLLLNHIKRLVRAIRQLPEVALTIRNAFIFELLTLGLAGLRGAKQHLLRSDYIIRVLNQVNPTEVAPLHSRRLLGTFFILPESLPPAWTVLIREPVAVGAGQAKLPNFYGAENDHGNVNEDNDTVTDVREGIDTFPTEEIENPSTSGTPNMSQHHRRFLPPTRHLPSGYYSREQRLQGWRRAHLRLSDARFEGSFILERFNSVPIPEIFTNLVLPTGENLIDAVIRIHWEVANAGRIVKWDPKLERVIFNCSLVLSTEEAANRLQQLGFYWLGRIYLLALHGTLLPPLSPIMKHVLTKERLLTPSSLSMAMDSSCMQHPPPDLKAFTLVCMSLHQLFRDFLLHVLL